MKKIFFLVFIIANISLFAQKDSLIVDQIVARVGDEIILQSDVESQYYQWLANGNPASKEARCMILENQLIQKLLINQAKIDSISVTDDEVDRQVQERINIYEQQLGGVSQLEKYLNKSIFDIKKDLKNMIGKQLLAQKERNSITKDVTITPSEVVEYFKSLPQDSIPLVDVTFQLSQIVFDPKLTKAEADITIQKLKDIRKKIVSGERKFESMARMYSQDDVSAKNGGELGFMSRGELDPKFAAVAFSLKKGEISKIVKSKFGYHIIQLIERRGERINVRHILIRQYIPYAAKQRTIAFADSVRNLIVKDSITFADAAKKYSDDKESRNNGGQLFNPMTGNTKFKINELPPNIKYDVINLKEHEVSEPIYTTDKTMNNVVKLYRIDKKIPQHIANLNDDYQLFYDKALAHKKELVFDNWVTNQQKQVYISIIPEFSKCKFKYKNWLKK